MHLAKKRFSLSGTGIEISQEGFKGLHLELVIDIMMIYTIVGIVITSVSNFMKDHNLSIIL